MTVCWFGAWDPGYPRNRVLLAGLERAGVPVTQARVTERRAVFRYPSLLAAYAASGHADALFVPSFRHKDVPLARALAGARPVVFDPLVSRHDTLVGDWAIHGEGSAQAAWNRGIDGWSFGLADVVLCDTWAHGALFESLGARRDRLRRVPVGAEDAFFQVPPAPAAGPVELVYAGGFLPLHGVPVLIEALARLEREPALPEYRVRLIGKGIEYDASRELAGRAGLARATFEGPRPYADLPRLLATAHVVLGAFGVTAKAGRVIPHKVWQGLASGRAVVTGAGEGLVELFENDTHLLAVPRGDAAALAVALARVIRDEGLRVRLGAAGRAHATESGTAALLGGQLRDILAGVVRA